MGRFPNVKGLYTMRVSLRKSGASKLKLPQNSVAGEQRLILIKTRPVVVGSAMRELHIVDSPGFTNTVRLGTAAALFVRCKIRLATGLGSTSGSIIQISAKGGSPVWFPHMGKRLRKTSATWAPRISTYSECRDN